MPIDEVKRVCFVGAGTMGSYNSLVTALAGYQVVLYDISAEALANSPDRQREWGPVFTEQGLYSQQDIEAALKRITRTTDPEEAARDADFLSESVLEQLELKRETHSKFDELLPAHAIMTTNTSTLLLSDIESAVKRGDRFAAMHFHQPSPLVDIVAGPRTSSQTMDIVKRFVKSQGQVYVVLKKERGGYLHNAMFASILGTGMMLSVLLKVDLREVDRAWMSNQNSQVGPFGMMDFVGLNVVADIFEEAQKKDDAGSPEIAGAIRNFLKPYLENGHLGAKTGKGFYTYPEPEFQKHEFLAGKEENKDLSRPMVNAFLATALTLVSEGHADVEDVDRSWMLTHNPEIGPFGTIDVLGLDVVKKDLEERAEQMEAMLGNPGTVRAQTDLAVALMDSHIERGELGVKTGQGFYRYPDPEYKKPEFLGVDKIIQFGRHI
jgi:enoyl-CoA hydratase/3-hydroxyacyl-CoA dehydrogenase